MKFGIVEKALIFGQNDMESHESKVMALIMKTESIFGLFVCFAMGSSAVPSCWPQLVCTLSATNHVDFIQFNMNIVLLAMTLVTAVLCVQKQIHTHTHTHNQAHKVRRKHTKRALCTRIVDLLV